MKQLFTGLLAGIGIACTSCCAVDYIKTMPVQVVLTDRNHVTTTTVTTEEGIYRIFMLERTNDGGAGIAAVKIK
ncbi:MAG: hypothetical protein MRZ46_08830 [Oscillospiraceae bacterium]|nr:hypothetical protein [Oscillospiraceae bacterium]